MFLEYLQVVSVMCDHGHGHGSGPCASSVANFDYGAAGVQYMMNSYIDKDKVLVLNEAVNFSRPHKSKI